MSAWQGVPDGVVRQVVSMILRRSTRRRRPWLTADPRPEPSAMHTGSRCSPSLVKERADLSSAKDCSTLALTEGAQSAWEVVGMAEDVLVERGNGLLVIMLNRPHVRNAMDA